MLQNLLQSPLFKGFNENNLERLLNNTHYNILHFSKGDMIALAEDPVTSLMIILEGKIKTEVLKESGKTLRMEDFGCSNIMAPGFVFGEKNTFPVNVIAYNATKIMVIPKSSFVEMLTKNHIVLNNFLDILSNKTQFLVGKIKNTFLLPIEGKMAKYILSMADLQSNTEFNLPNSQTWLAEKFGVTRPSVTRVLSKMNAKGIIEQKGKHLRILNRKELQKCATRI